MSTVNDIEHPWILMTQSPMGLWCQHCDRRLNVALPVEIGEYLAATEAFIARHATCQDARHAASELAGAPA